MDIYGAFILKEGLISLSLHKISATNNNLIYTTVPFYNQNSELSFIRESICMAKTWPPFFIFIVLITKKK